MQNLIAFDLLKATESAALAAARWVGKGNAEEAEKVAASRMHGVLSRLTVTGQIILGHPGDHLYEGERAGPDGEREVDLAVDPLECTKSVAFGRTNAMAVATAVPPRRIYYPPTTYMEKIAVGAEAVGAIDITKPVEVNLAAIAEAKRYRLSDLTVVILDRERHRELIHTVRQSGARIHLIPDGDVSAAIAAATPGTGIDVLVGVGGSAAGVLAAAALRCLGGEMQARLSPIDQDEARQTRTNNPGDLGRVLRADDLIKGDEILFSATGVTDGDMLNGVRLERDVATTHSMLLNHKEHTRRYVVAEHRSAAYD